MNQFENVKDFMRTFGQEVPNRIVIPSFDTLKLRLILNLEETFELAEAMGIKITAGDYGNRMTVKECSDLSFEKVGEPDMVEIADALADIDYVNNGCAAACGLPFDEIKQKVHDSNMTKLWSATELGTKPIPENWSVVEVNGIQSEKRFIVKNENRKVVKSPSYAPVDLGQYVPN